MNKLKTTYMGIELNNPIIIGASNLVTDLETLKKAEEQGAQTGPILPNEAIGNRSSAPREWRFGPYPPAKDHRRHNGELDRSGSRGPGARPGGVFCAPATPMAGAKPCGGLGAGSTGVLPQAN